MIPGVRCSNYRYVHFQHHRFTNAGSKLDPDDWAVRGPTWTLPFRWMTMHFRYIYFYLKNISGRSVKEWGPALVIVLLALCVYISLTLNGHYFTLSKFYFEPQLASFCFLAFAFNWMPHAPNKTKEENDTYRATNVRKGMEWLLTPALMSQNYHLVHHLYPRTPFYMYPKVWRELEPELVSRGASVVSAVGARQLNPEY